MEKIECTICHKPKAKLECGICHCAICKNCTEFMEENRLAFLPTLPAGFETGAFCQPCYAEKVQPAIEAYDQDIERAKEVIVFQKKQTKETRYVKRIHDPVVVEHCLDHDETLLRLAYQAVKAGYMGLVDVEISSVKIREGSRQHSDYSGYGVPAEIDLSKVPKDRAIWQNPN